MSIWALVPVKARVACKTRLASRLTPAQRLALVRAMLDHVLDVLRAVPALDRIALVSPERDGVANDVLLLPDPDRGLNACLDAALQEVAARGASAAVIVSGDLPLLTPEEIVALIAATGSGQIAVAPDRTLQGSNAIGLALPTRVRLQLGPDSYARHHAEALRLGLRFNRVDAPGLAFDVDKPADVRALGKQPTWRQHASPPPRPMLEGLAKEGKA